uniref:BPTI/Kunitz inhibitor domain-containing protein n=1 Tax=Ditylenchus dipsaci TaxID=166011 RepID=A0A915E9W7_9BILA
MDKLNIILFSSIVLSSYLVIADDSVQPDKSVCLNARDRGESSCPGKSPVTFFYYDQSTKHCQPFLYSGCGGNANRFESSTQCQEMCSGSPVAEDQHGGGGHGLVLPVAKCAGGVRSALDSEHRKLGCDECPSGYSCVEDQCCPSKEHTCTLAYDTGKYATQGSHTPRYFYSKSVNNCLLFTYYGALGNANNFETYKDCINFCSKSD